MSKTLQDLISDDPEHVYTEEELDAIEELDPVMALRLARVQHLAEQQREHQEALAALGGEIDEELVREAIDEARAILAQDGGDIEYVALVEKDVVQVRLKGACVGCPNAVLDLKNVVERLVRMRVPAVRKVENTF